MRTIKHILITGCIALAVSSCDYLDQQPYEYWQPEETFIDYNKTIQMLNSVYVSMPNGYQSNYTAFLDASTDDGAYVDPANAMYKLGQGYATEISPIENRWADLYIGIRRTLYFEQYIPLLQNNAGWTDAQVESYKELAIAESKSVRALYYFELIKRYGGVPLVKKTYTLDDKEVITLPRNSFSECVDYIVGLCNEATEVFTRYKYITNQYRTYGFLSASMCSMAIKAKTLAYAASPLFNSTQNPILGYTDGNAQERWKLAAKALKEVIDLDPSKLHLYSDFEKLFIIQPNQNPEYIVYTGNPKSYILELYNYPPSLLGSGGTCPSHNLVSAFEKIDGSANDMQSDNQFENMDSRFNATIIYDGCTLGARGEINISDPNSQDAIGKINLRSTVTGYYLRKFLDTNINLSAQSITNTYHYFPVIRLADIYLLYAEAMNEAYGPNDAADLGLTALDALNKVRDRAGITTRYTTTSQAEMEKKIRNERRVELAFEDQHYFDLRRWKVAEKDLNQPLMGFRIERQDGGAASAHEFVVDGQRKFNTKMYYSPIPYSEMQLNTNLVQNPGWR
ncbi:RagB/SusD family nutrient uptake outer membrane protein [uncultured Bacteroides sp.]|uniref:RagB/SusD family nutrient uptake outer membrane protein n=1 Tax=uncultured Bacteroides sp. TaxID=162156 RepID=UPI0025DA122D|nr:RagB/SusD family nutrient uptake outer membrane protein [uncultured Bacteroides sp.]